MWLIAYTDAPWQAQPQLSSNTENDVYLNTLNVGEIMNLSVIKLVDLVTT